MEFHATDKDVPLDNKWRTEIVRLNEMIAKTSFNLAAAQTEISLQVDPHDDKRGL